MRRAKLIDDSKLMISKNDLDESFYFDYSRFEGGECPICLLLPSGEFVDYAQDFYDFLERRIKAYSEGD